MLTPHADSCLPGITRGTVISIAREAGIPFTERNVSLTEIYTADEVFTTGTVGELSPVLEVDGRKSETKASVPLQRGCRNFMQS